MFFLFCLYVLVKIQLHTGFIKEEIANDDKKVKGLIIGLKESLGLQRAISINPDIEYGIYKISFELLKNNRAFVYPLRVVCTSLSTKSMKCF